MMTLNQWRELREWMQHLSEIATLMNELNKVTGAPMLYDLMMGSIYWPDEIPDFKLKLGLTRKESKKYRSALKLVLAYRMSLMLNQPDETLYLLWLEAQLLFPNWCGFAPDRCSHKQIYVELQEKKERQIDEMIKEAEEDS